MTWNHRVRRRGDCFDIVEAYYDDGGSLNGWTKSGMAPFGESVEELRKDLERMLKALDKPVIEDID